MSELERVLGHRFVRPELLAAALTHPSSCARRSGPADFERLEFLGDRVLALVAADQLFERFPGESEGALAHRHVALVRREALESVARDIDLGRHLVLSRGEAESAGRDHPGILGDALEAVIAALYLDGGLDAARSFIARHWPALMLADAVPPKDAKTALQEWAQGAGRPLPSYEVVHREGPDHKPLFSVEVRVEGEAPATAVGPSKRIAEQAAAERLLRRLAPRRDG